MYIGQMWNVKHHHFIVKTLIAFYALKWKSNYLLNSILEISCIRSPLQLAALWLQCLKCCLFADYCSAVLQQS